MSAIETSQSVFEEIQEEHESLQDLYSRVRAEFKSALAEKPHGLNGLFTDLVDILEQHFAHEEEGGYFHEIIETLPRFVSTVDRLRRQHAVLLESAEVMRLRLLRPQDSVVSLRAMQVEFDDFLRQCCDHEKREDELVQEAYWQDIGAAD